MKKAISGFTIVELLIVIVVISILATISVVAYNGVQSRGRDGIRLNDIAAIQKALEYYKSVNGVYPEETSTGGSWESSADTDFMEYLNPSYITKVPLDPSNNASSVYRYYKYPANSYGCTASRGNYYVLGINNIEGSSRPAPSSPGFSCNDGTTSRNWGTEFDWVIGKFDND